MHLLEIVAVYAAVCLCLTTQLGASQRSGAEVERNENNLGSDINPVGSRQCVTDVDLHKSLMQMKCKIAETEQQMRLAKEDVQKLEEQQDSMKADYEAKIQQILARVEESERQLREIRNDKMSQSQTSFYAKGLRDGYDSDAYNKGDRLIYQTPLINPGGHYDNITGEYTCPTSGVYMFLYSVYGVHIKQGDSHSRLTASLYREGDEVSLVWYTNSNDNNTYLTLSHSDLVTCKKGQRVWVQSGRNRNFIRGYSQHNVFGGVLIYTV